MPDEAQPTTTADSNDPVDRAMTSIKALPEKVMLADLVGPAAAPGAPVAYVPPTLAMRTESRQLIHDRALKDIVRLRFGFPTEKYRDYKTYVNHPARTMGVAMEDGRVAYPDIVVVPGCEDPETPPADACLDALREAGCWRPRTGRSTGSPRSRASARDRTSAPSSGARSAPHRPRIAGSTSDMQIHE